MVNECTNSKLNDCDKNAVCMDNDLSYECLCREGYIDTSPMPSLRPGLKCRKRESLNIQNLFLNKSISIFSNE